MSIDETIAACGAYAHWSPIQMANALGYRVQVRGKPHRRIGWFIRPSGREHPMEHSHACRVLSRMLAYQGIDPAIWPSNVSDTVRDSEA